MTIIRIRNAKDLRPGPYLERTYDGEGVYSYKITHMWNKDGHLWVDGYEEGEPPDRADTLDLGAHHFFRLHSR